MDVISAADWTVFLIVVGLRFGLPLLIPFYPLPAILVCLVLDGVDQTIFQTFTELPLDGYQSYDKALDIYYLTVAYISTFRNWTNDFAFHVSRFLYYYRLIGVVLFEVFQARALLLVFPNTFEYFFIWYESVRLFWNPKRLTQRTILLSAAAIWIVIKLPQEYWIHIAQRDATDTVKELLGGTPESAWGPLIAGNLLAILLVVGTLGGAGYLLYRFLKQRLPEPDHPVAWRADDYAELPTEAQIAAARQVWQERVFDRDLVEKIVLISLLTLIFSYILPSSDSSAFRIVANVAAFVTIDTILSHLVARRGKLIASGIVYFLGLAAVNTTIILSLNLLFGRETNWLNAAFFVGLLSLIVTLLDRFQPYHLARFPREKLFRRLRGN